MQDKGYDVGCEWKSSVKRETEEQEARMDKEKSIPGQNSAK